MLLGYLGLILWVGSSALDGTPIIVIATCITRDSKNGKTGPMIQVFIVPVGNAWLSDPLLRYAVCGDCKLGACGACYVRGDSVCKVAQAILADRYVATSPRHVVKFSRGRHIRISAWGDGAAVPIGVWTTIIESFRAVGQRHTMYSHQWDKPKFLDFRHISMASVDTPEERERAKALGFRTFRTVLPGEKLGKGERFCPAARKPGSIYCNRCLRCDGGCKGLDYAVIAHGPKHIVTRYRNLRLAM